MNEREYKLTNTHKDDEILHQQEVKYFNNRGGRRKEKRDKKVLKFKL